MSSCCSPSRSGAAASTADQPMRTGNGHPEGMLVLPGGTFRMGTEDADGFPGDDEGPIREVEVAAFAIDPLAVTNARFADFIGATGYRTEAEQYGWSFVFAKFLPASLRKKSRRPDATPWWCGVRGAFWRQPEGPGSDVSERGDHPAVHVSWNDAVAYCQWAGTRLPTEAEWEYAARGGLDQARFPWGDELEPGGEHRCNVWQGQFPVRNTEADGYAGTAPVDAFEANGFGLHNVSGNTWEWCANRFAEGAESRAMRGGSYLCHDSYCNRYRLAARTKNTPDSSSGNQGFRCVLDV